MNMNGFSFRGAARRGMDEQSPNLSTLYKVGHFRKASGRQKYSNHAVRNRRIIIIAAGFIAFWGLLSIFL